MSSDGGYSDSKKYKWGLWWDLTESAFSGSLESGGRFYVVTFDTNLAEITERMFSRLIYVRLIKECL
jgi:hypothetical protein